jgi:hypothetical protein
MYLGTPIENLRLLKNVLLLDGHQAAQRQTWIVLARNTSPVAILPMFHLSLIESNAYLWPWNNIPGQNVDILHPA